MKTRIHADLAMTQNHKGNSYYLLGSILKRRAKAAALSFGIWAMLLLCSFLK